MLGEDADRVHEIEPAVAEIMREQITLDQADGGCDAVVPVRMPRLRQHRAGCIEADQAPRARHGPEIPARPAAELEHVDWRCERAADARQPARKQALRLPSL